MSDHPYEYDHHHNECARLPCPRCGVDPTTGNVNNDDRTIWNWSCSLCTECWTTYEADLPPEERELHLIEEAFP